MSKTCILCGEGIVVGNVCPSCLEKPQSSIPSTSVVGNIEERTRMKILEKEHQSRCRIADAKCVLSKALSEYKPEGLTMEEAAIACLEQADFWMREAWRAGLADDVANATASPDASRKD